MAIFSPYGYFWNVTITALKFSEFTKMVLVFLVINQMDPFSYYNPITKPIHNTRPDPVTTLAHLSPTSYPSPVQNLN